MPVRLVNSEKLTRTDMEQQFEGLFRTTVNKICVGGDLDYQYTPKHEVYLHFKRKFQLHRDNPASS